MLDYQNQTDDNDCSAKTYIQANYASIEKKKKLQTSPALTLITWGVNPTPADPASQYG